MLYSRALFIYFLYRYCVSVNHRLLYFILFYFILFYFLQTSNLSLSPPFPLVTMFVFYVCEAVSVL